MKEDEMRVMKMKERRRMKEDEMRVMKMKE